MRMYCNIIIIINAEKAFLTQKCYFNREKAFLTQKGYFNAEKAFLTQKSLS